LAATQDIAVDGLALTILSPCNKELGATCNTIGQSLGFLISSAGFLAFYSPEFCNAYLRPAAAADPEAGLLTLGGFMMFWGWLFLASTVWVARVDKDEHTRLCGSLRSILASAYGEMLLVLRLPAVRSISIVLLTCRAALGVFGQATSLHITRAGMPKEHLALLFSCAMVFGMLVQAYVTSRYLTNSCEAEAKPLSVYGHVYPARLLMGAISAVLVAAVGAHKEAEDGLPYWLYAAVAVSIFAGVAVQETAFVAQMAFFNRVADPSIGGTYMTMLNTIANLGAQWPNTAALFLIDGLQWTRPCSCDPSAETATASLWPYWGMLQASVTQRLVEVGVLDGGAAAAHEAPCECQPVVVVDGYSLTCALSLVVGLVWLVLMRPRVFKLQALPSHAWMARVEKSSQV